MENNREKELKEKIIRCRASMALSDNTIEMLQIQKILDKAIKELTAIEKRKSTKGE